jgi:hypothetical protein
MKLKDMQIGSLRRHSNGMGGTLTYTGGMQ